MRNNYVMTREGAISIFELWIARWRRSSVNKNVVKRRWCLRQKVHVEYQGKHDQVCIEAVNHVTRWCINTCVDDQREETKRAVGG